MFMAARKIIKRKRRTDAERFLDEVKKLSNGGKNPVNAKVLRDKLRWQEEEQKFNRIKGQLKDQNLIFVVPGGPGGSIGIVNAKGNSAIPIFISYSSVDEDMKSELIKHLEPLKRLNLISEWNVRKIVAGEQWAQEISDKLQSAKIILLLLSVDFLNSQYCYDIELERALARNDAQECAVIPVLLRNCVWQHAPFAKLSGLPKNMTAVASCPYKDDAYVDIVKGIKEAVEKMIDDGISK